VVLHDRQITTKFIPNVCVDIRRNVPTLIRRGQYPTDRVLKSLDQNPCWKMIFDINNVIQSKNTKERVKTQGCSTSPKTLLENLSRRTTFLGFFVLWTKYKRQASNYRLILIKKSVKQNPNYKVLL
jgi:hypothetical protein